MPLPGWSQEEIETIVLGLHTGSWDRFQAVVASGSGEETVQPPGPSSGNEGQGSWSSVPFGRFGRPRRYVAVLGLIVLWVCWCCLRTGLAIKLEPGDPEIEQCPQVDSTALQVRPDALDVDSAAEETFGCDGSVLWELTKILGVILTWETAKWGWKHWFAARKFFAAAGSQTEALNDIPMPLCDLIRCRGKILYCLWRAGFQFDVDSYPLRIQTEFYDLVGSYWVRVDQGFVSETDSD